MADDLVFIEPINAAETRDGRPAKVGLVVISQELRERIITDDPTAPADLYTQVRAAILAGGQ